MKVISVHTYPYEVGGSERTLHQEREALTVAGHEVRVVGATAQRPRDVYYLSRPQLFGNSTLHQPSLTALRAASLLVQEESPDVIHVHGYPRTDVMALWQRLRPVVTTAHTPLCPNASRYRYRDQVACDREIGVVCLTRGYRENGCGHTGDGKPYSLLGFVKAMHEDRQVRHAIAASARVIAPSRWMERRLVADGISPEKVVVLAPPVYESPPTAPSHWPSPPSLLYAGRLVAVKGVDHLLRAFSGLPRNVRLLIAGDGPEREDLESLAESLGCTERTHFLGMQSPAQLAVLRSQATACVLPSLWPENWSMAGWEAVQSGLPVVAYDVGGSREWCVPGVTGLLVPPGDVGALADALRLLIASPFRPKSRDTPDEAARTKALLAIYSSAELAFKGQRPVTGGDEGLQPTA